MDRLQVVVGGLFGSCGKGAIAAYLCHPDRFHDGIAVRVGGSQAGHTAYDSDGRKWPLRHIPVAAVVNHDTQLVIAAGSEIDPAVLLKEITELEDAGHPVRKRLFVDPSATVISDLHKQIERGTKLTDRIGSTAKGVGAARSERIMRTADIVAFRPDLLPGINILPTSRMLNRHVGQILIEGVQGYGLGLHTLYYPYTTSSDARAVDFLAMAGIVNLELLAEAVTWVVFRPYPIRVAGNSGPLRYETSWDALGLPPEKTTVTQKTRRVGHWDPELAWEAVRANGGPHQRVRLALTMADQLDPSAYQITDPELLGSVVSSWVKTIEHDTGSPGQLQLIGTSPNTICDLRGTP